MKIINKHPIAFTLVSLGLIISTMFLMAFLASRANVVSASAPSGLLATVATSSRALVNTTASTLIGTTTCTARIISTATSSVMLTFSDYAGQSPSDSFGNWQAASTTIAYDSGIYGCGKVKAWSQATQQITITETQ